MFDINIPEFLDTFIPAFLLASPLFVLGGAGLVFAFWYRKHNKDR